MIAIVTKDDQANTLPAGEDRVEKGDRITVLGKTENIQHLNEIIGEG